MSDFSMLFLLAFRYSETVAVYAHYHSLPSFKFGAGGSYNITFHELVGYRPRFALFTKSGFNDFVALSPTEACNSPTGFINLTSDVAVAGTIAADQTVYPTIVGCRLGLAFTLDLACKNPTTYLDLRVEPGAAVNIVFFCIFFVLATAFIVLFVRHLIDRQPMNYILFGVLVLPLIDHLFGYCELRVIGGSDADHGLTATRAVFHALSYAYYTFVFLVAVAGLSIVFETLGREFFAEAALVAGFFTFSLLEFCDWQHFTVEVQLALFIVAFILIASEMYRFVTAAEKHTAGLVAASDPEAAVIRARYHRLKLVASAVSVIIVVNVLFDFIFVTDEWVQELLVGISELTVSVGFIAIYRRRPVTRYQSLQRNGDDDGSAVVVADLDDRDGAPDATALEIPAQPLLGNPDSLPRIPRGDD
jgi:hypothetical protein